MLWRNDPHVAAPGQRVSRHRIATPPLPQVQLRAADADGFCRRMARLVEQGKVWVWSEGGRLIFKAVVISETPEVTYLEGIDVHPEERGRGYGGRCVSQLARRLLATTESLVLLVEERNQGGGRVLPAGGVQAAGLL